MAEAEHREHRRVDDVRFLAFNDGSHCRYGANRVAVELRRALLHRAAVALSGQNVTIRPSPIRFVHLNKVMRLYRACRRISDFVAPCAPGDGGVVGTQTEVIEERRDAESTGGEDAGRSRTSIFERHRVTRCISHEVNESIASPRCATLANTTSDLNPSASECPT